MAPGTSPAIWRPESGFQCGPLLEKFADSSYKGRNLRLGTLRHDVCVPHDGRPFPFFLFCPISVKDNFFSYW